MRFQTLQRRLIAHIRERVRSGELTERGLARLAGISQPHVHHVLKGARELSPAAADRILGRLNVSLLDLLEPAELAGRIAQSLPKAPRYDEVAMLEGRIGPGYPMPAVEHPLERYPFLRAQIEGLESPVAARLAGDVEMLDLFGPGDVVLFDRREDWRLDPDPEGYYVLEQDGGGLIRRVRRGAARLEVAPAGPFPRVISLVKRHILDVIRGQVIWIGRQIKLPRSE